MKNNKCSCKRLSQIILANHAEFNLLITLSYASSHLPKSDAGAKCDIQNWLRKVRRAYSLCEKKIKYIMTCERSKGGRPHFYIICNDVGISEILMNKWDYGRTYIEPVAFNEKNSSTLCAYILRGNLFSKRWCASKNLERPRILERKYITRKWKVERDGEIKKMCE